MCERNQHFEVLPNCFHVEVFLDTILCTCAAHTSVYVFCIAWHMSWLAPALGGNRNGFLKVKNNESAKCQSIEEERRGLI